MTVKLEKRIDKLTKPILRYTQWGTETGREEWETTVTTRVRPQSKTEPELVCDQLEGIRENLDFNGDNGWVNSFSDWAEAKYLEQALINYLLQRPWEMPEGSAERLQANKALWEAWRTTKPLEVRMSKYQIEDDQFVDRHQNGSEWY